MASAKNHAQSIGTAIIYELLRHPDGFVSGNALAKSLSISRVTIWEHLQKLKQEGFSFEAKSNQGYRLLKEPTALNPTLLNAYLKREKVSPSLVFLQSIDSTNSEAERQLASHCPSPVAVIALKQTQGRGRFGRTWYSKSPSNIYLSLGFKSDLPTEIIKTFTPWMAVQFCALLNQTFNLPIQTKWPNDLVLEGKKVAGMLAEARLDIDRIRELVFGIGLNVNTSTKKWPNDLSSSATSLKSYTHKMLNLNKITASLIANSIKAYEDFISGRYQKTFASLWETYDSLYQKKITAYEGNVVYKGKALGINSQGALRLLLPNGKMKILCVGEISLSHPIGP